MHQVHARVGDGLVVDAVEVLEGVSHWIPPEEVPDTLTRLLLDHLASGQ